MLAREWKTIIKPLTVKLKVSNDSLLRKREFEFFRRNIYGNRINVVIILFSHTERRQSGIGRHERCGQGD